MSDKTQKNMIDGVGQRAATLRRRFLVSLRGLSRRLVLRALQSLNRGTLEFVEANGTRHVFGAGSGAEPKGCIEVLDEDFWTDLLFGGSISVAAGGSYMRGHWRSPDLSAMLRFFAANEHVLLKLSHPLLTLPMRALMWFRHHVLNTNTVVGAQRNIAAHYDLDSNFFKLFLDEEMMYSCNIYPKAASTLDEAARHRMNLICKRLELKKDDHLLEIGSGWGGLAIFAARKYKCRVTSITISKGQHEYALQRVRDEGMEDRVEILLRDYRAMEGKFDKLVSVEMIEAVGAEYFKEYFRRCSDFLKPDGLMLIQGIFVPDHKYLIKRMGVDFNKQYIFPGGCLPSLAVVMRAIAKRTDLQLIDLNDITTHYVRTLSDWCERFMSQLDKVREMKFDEEFIRMWEFYLRYCQSGFDQRLVSNYQLLFAKPDYRFPQKAPPRPRA